MSNVVACLCHRDLAHVIRLGTGLELLECQGCGLYTRRERPEPETLVAHYRQEYWTQYAAEHATEARSNLFEHVMDRLQHSR